MSARFRVLFRVPVCRFLWCVGYRRLSFAARIRPREEAVGRLLATVARATPPRSPLGQRQLTRDQRRESAEQGPAGLVPVLSYVLLKYSKHVILNIGFRT